jgi:tetratricopeptide (TPR) repeat protein
MRDTKFVQSHPPLSRLTSINIDSPDAKARFMIWDMAIKGFKERPVLGWGQEGFNFVFNKYFNPEMHGREQWFDRTHNIILDWLIAGGILALLSYLSLIVFALIYITGVGPKFVTEKMGNHELFKFSLLEKSILVGLLAGYFFQNLFVFDNTVSYILFFSLLAFVHSNRATTIKKMESIEEVSESDVKDFFVYVAIVVLVVVIWFVNIKHILTANDLIKALSSHKDSPVSNIQYFKSALGRNSFADQEIIEQLGQISSMLLPNNNVSSEVKSDLLKLTMTEMEKHVKFVPNDPRMRIFLASLQSMVGLSNDAIKQLEEASRLSPKKQVIKAGLASEYIKVGRTGEAYEVMKSAYESAPHFKDIAFSYLISAMYTKNKSYVDQILKESFDGNFPEDQRLIQVYLDIGESNKAIALAKKIADGNPKDVQASLRLGEVYLSLGMKYKTIEIIRELISKNPELKEQGEQLIKQVEATK